MKTLINKDLITKNKKSTPIASLRVSTTLQHKKQRTRLRLRRGVTMSKQNTENITYNSYYDTEEFMQKNKDEVHTNRKFFESILDDIIKEHRDEFVLVKNQKVIGYFPTYGEAKKVANSTISDNIYSIHEVTDEAIELGFFSNATI